jgi:type I restriction enzyme S subunit
MSGVAEVLSSTYPDSVQPGIPRLGATPPGWRRVRLRDVLEIVPRPVIMNKATEYRLLTVKRSRGGIVERSRLLGGQISVKSQFRVEGGDFLISKRQIVHGACAVVPDEFSGAIVSNEYAVLRCRGGLDLGYLKHLSNSVYFQQTCFHSCIGVHIEKMIFKVEEWLEREFDLPTTEKQHEIAGSVDAVDRKIALLRDKRDALARFRAGIMDRIFRREIRFRKDDGSEFPEWREARIGQIYIWIPTNSLSRERLTEKVASVQNIHYGDIHRRLRTLFRQSKSGVSFISPSDTFTPREVEFCRPGDIVIADASEDIADIGKLVEIIEARERSLVAGLHTMLARPNRGAVVVGFGGYMLSSTAVRRQIQKLAQGVSVFGISKPGVAEVVVQLPSLDEQAKIAAALSAIDAKIDAVAAQIERTKTFRRGLIQGLFP